MTLYGSQSVPTCAVHGVELVQRIYGQVFGYYVRASTWHCLVCEAATAGAGYGKGQGE